MTDRERQIRRRAATSGLTLEKSYGARFEFSRCSRHAFLALGHREAEVWLEGYEAGIARVFESQGTQAPYVADAMRHELFDRSHK